MSLIHKMLRELEEHTQKNNAKQSDIQNDYIVFQPAGFSKNAKIICAGLLGILLITSMSTFFLLKEKHSILFPFQKIDKIFLSKTHAETTPIKNKKEINTKQTQAIIKTMIPMDPKDKSDLLYQQSTDFIEMGNISQAVLKLERAVQLNPVFHKAREALIVLLIQQNHYHQANTIVNEGLILSPDNVPFLKLKAHVLIALKRYNDALIMLTQNVVNLRQHPDYYALMAVAYEKDENYIAAAKVYNDLLQVQPYNGNFWFGLGVSLQNADKKEAATEAFQKALKTNKLDPKIRAYLETRTND